ncbi:transposase [Endozoicomonas sp. 4G]|uniref:RNA-guided endonuclease InsQ/TnpB family protein n=1 Tax=Endozoicomonas sp. 4G TaxID=2872754 RepID=UPI0020791747|nr:transposase [Endozoicomonas sp. 4G]
MELRKATYKLYPTKQQAEALNHALRLHCEFYNAALQERIEAYRKCRISIKNKDQQPQIKVIREEIPEFATLNYSSLQVTLRRLDKAFSVFFRRVNSGEKEPGFPRFKSHKRYPGIGFSSHGDGWRFTPGEDWKHGRLRLTGVGHIRCRGKARVAGKIKSMELLHRRGEWLISLTMECNGVLREPTSGKACGLDWGVNKLLSVATESDGYQVDNPRWFQQEREKLKALKQAVSRKKKGSNRWKKACKKLSTHHRKAANRRNHEHHQLSAQVASQYALVATEKLQVKNMTGSAKGTSEKPGKNVKQKAGLNREILDTAPATLLAMIAYKVKETGGLFIETPTRKLKPSQRCPVCWSVKKKTLKERVHQCEVCGCNEDRDIAAARVNLIWALNELGSETGLHRACSVKPPPSL